MSTRASKTAEDVADTIADSIKSMIDRVVDAELTREIARRGQDVAGILADRGADVADRASDAWRDTRDVRRDAAKRVSQATGEAAKRSDSVWRDAIAPTFKDIWKRRTVAAGAAGAAVPAGRELLETAAVRLGLKERQREEERRRWGVFFLGLVLGAAAGAIAALLTTPKRGSEVRRELGVRADELATRAREVAKEADWMPVFQREEDSGNGHGISTAVEPKPKTVTPAVRKPRASRTLQSAAADSGIAAPSSGTGSAADRAATDTAGAINDAYEVDREKG
jgi:gas vesicle protein